MKVEVTGLFTTHHRFDTDRGTWGELSLPAFSNQGVFRRGDGRELVMRKVHWLGTAHEVLDGETLRASADRPGIISPDFVISLEGRQYLLQQKGWTGGNWTLSDDRGSRLLEIRRRGILRQGTHLMFTGPVNTDLVAFAYYLVWVRGQEAAVGAAAATAPQ
jgi:hypothetical protein